jgi:hypothetical protein
MADDVKVIIKALLDDKDFKKGINDITKKAGDSAKKQQGFLKKIKGSYILLAGVITGVVAAAFGKAVKMASEFEESNAKFGTTFAGVSKEANAMRRELVNSFGVSSLAATKLLSSTGDLLSGFGMTGDSALQMAGDVNKLAIDLASFTNAQGGAEAVSNALNRAILGERESLKTYGIAIREADIDAELLAKGMQNLTGEALLQAKGQATLAIAMRQSKNAIGDFERTQDSFANTMRRIKAVSEDVTVIIGQSFMEAVGPAVKEIGEFVKSKEGIEAIGNGVRGVVAAFLVLWSTIKTITNAGEILVQSTISGFKQIQLWAGAFKRGFSETMELVKEEQEKLKEKNAVDSQDISDSWENTTSKIKEMFSETFQLQVEGMDNIVDKNGETQGSITTTNVEELVKRDEAEKIAAQKSLARNEASLKAYGKQFEKLTEKQQIEAEKMRVKNNKLWDDIVNEAERGVDIIVDDYSDGLANMIVEGKKFRKTFGDFIKDLIKQVIKLIAKLVIAKAAKTALTGGLGLLFSKGGVVPKYMSNGGKVLYAANGVNMEPRGTDTVPAMLTPGERVLSVGQNEAFEKMISTLNLPSAGGSSVSNSETNNNQQDNRQFIFNNEQMGEASFGALVEEAELQDSRINMRGSG